MWSLLGILHNTENEEAGVTFNNVDESYTQNGEWKKKKKRQSQKDTFCMLPFVSSSQNRQS